MVFSFGLPAMLAAQDYVQRAYGYVADTYKMDRAVVGDLRLTASHTSPQNDVTHAYYVQVRDGRDVFGTALNLAFLPSGKIVGVNHRLKDLRPSAFTSSRPRLSPEAAILAGARSLGVQSRGMTSLRRITEYGTPMYDKADISLQDIPVVSGYQPMPDGGYRLAWRVTLETASTGKMYDVLVDALTGDILSQDLLTLSCRFEDGFLGHEACEDAPVKDDHALFPPALIGVAAVYNVLPVTVESPAHGNFSIVSDPANPIASPFGWHDTDGAAGPEYTYTRGNNVHAFPDRNWDYLPDGTVDGGNDLNFNFPYNEAGEPSGNRNVAVTNLFYWNNIMHDLAYRYGFTEAAGNFQATNYTGQGASGDYVEAHAQFGDDNTLQCGNQTNGGTECINNADFSTPADGSNGRMRMFTWNQDNGGKYLDVLQPVDLAGKITTGLAAFGPEITTTPVTGEVVVADDGTFEGSKGCNPSPDGSLAGKIAIIDRGLCDFSQKVYYAQQAGAIGVIICNFEDAIIQMGAGANAGNVAIPSVFISSGDCQRIRIAAGNGLVVSLVAPASGGPVKRDGSLDNGIIAHEFTHGISTRLAGGPLNSGCLAPNGFNAAEEAYGMGEGWSDFFALIATVRPGDTGGMRRGVGTYAIKESTNGKGIRSYPYSTDMTNNPHTYDNIQTESVPHGVGSVWCAMLWDMYWAFTDQYGFDPDPINGSGGNNIAIQLVIDGLKLQPCQPSFTEARDAILAADEINNGGANQCLIWQAFARRGLGVNATAGDPNSRADGEQGFDLPTACLNEVRFSKSMTPEVKAGEEIEVTLRVINYQNETLTNAVIEDPVPAGCTYIAGSATLEPVIGNTLAFTLPPIGADEEFVVTYRLATDPGRPSIRLFFDDIEETPEDRWDIYFDPAGSTDNLWFQQDVLANSGEYAWGIGDIEVVSEHYLQNFEPYSITGALPVYRFYHYFNTEAGADGGFLELSTDDGFSWRRLENKIFRGGYPRKLQYGTFAIPNLYAYSGLSNNELKMTPVFLDLSEWKGQQVKIRYRFGTDDNTAGDGWYIDDVEIMDAVIYNETACFVSDQTDMLCAEAAERGTIIDSELSTSTTDRNYAGDLLVLPNPASDALQVFFSSTAAGEGMLHLFDLTGHRLKSLRVGLHEGVNQWPVSLEGIPGGLYMVRLETHSGWQTQKFIKG